MNVRDHYMPSARRVGTDDVRGDLEGTFMLMFLQTAAPLDFSRLPPFEALETRSLGHGA